MTKVGRVGVIGRFKPLHNGAYAMLEAACTYASQVIIGIGSANKYNLRNPFTPGETEAMIKAALSSFSNFSVVTIPDFAHIPEFSDGKRWKEYVIKTFGELDYFITSNEYVKTLLEDIYPIVHPVELIPRAKQIPLRASEVRYHMACHQDWESLVPKSIAEYIEKNNLDERFRSEFGLATIAIGAVSDFNKNEDELEEKIHAQEL